MPAPKPDKSLFTEENRQKELRLIEAETNPMLQLYLFQLHTRLWDEHDAEERLTP
jgi:hypothetical protein